MNVTCKNDILLKLLNNFFKSNQSYLNKFLDIYYGRSNISLRIIDWFVTNYSKTNKIYYDINGNNFIVHLDYKSQLKAYTKKQFDPFCRRERMNFYYAEKKFIKTTIGQLNFFKWAFENNIIDYIEKNINDIESHMTIEFKEKKNNLNIKAKKTINKHNVKITVSFD